MENSELEAENIKKRDGGGCNCISNKRKPPSFIYTLPFPLDVDIVPYISNLGTPSVSFEKTSLLRIENYEVSITGVKGIREVRFTLKNRIKPENQQLFEEDLIKYVRERKI